MYKKGIVLLTLLFLALAGCSEAPKKAKAPEKPPEPVGGQYAFYQMFAAARSWAPDDIQTMQLISINLPTVKHVDGKAGAWQAVFVSASKGKSKSYTYSVIEAEGNLHKGVFAGHEEGYAGPRGTTKPFIAAAVKNDSDHAYKIAAGKSEAYMKKNPEMQITYLLELTTRFPNPAWRVIWGDSVSHSSYFILVDASTGNYLETLH